MDIQKIKSAMRDWNITKALAKAFALGCIVLLFISFLLGFYLGQLVLGTILAGVSFIMVLMAIAIVEVGFKISKKEALEGFNPESENP